MTLRVVLGAVLFVSLAIASAFFIFSVTFVRDKISALLTPETAQVIDEPLRMLLAGQAAGLFLLALALSVIVFSVISFAIARPLRRLERAITVYATSGEQIPIEGVAGAPKEIRSLALSFENLVSRVGESRKRDSEMSRVKSDFISTAAHQLRTPLTGIRWAHEALLKDTLTESQKALVESAVAKSKDLVSIVGTLLDISAIESSKYQYHYAPVSVYELLGEIAKDFAPLAADRQVSLFFSQDGEVSPVARADRERIKWVLNNLVENAIVYTPTGGTVRLSADASEQRVFIRVKDSGIGIESKDRANIFERFYRSQNAINKENKGNGLGLYIARTIATDHGGDLSFNQNEEGPGTTFTLSLPLAS